MKGESDDDDDVAGGGGGGQALIGEGILCEIQSREKEREDNVANIITQ